MPAVARRRLASAAVVAVAALVAPATALAHTELAASDPASGATLAVPPDVVRITLVGEPEPKLSQIAVFDARGRRQRTGAVREDGRSLQVSVAGLAGGVYTVRWQAVSAADGHATSGAFRFGVGADPGPPVSAAAQSTSRTSAGEVVARWVLLVGLVALIGAAAAAAGRFGGPADLPLAAVAWLLAVAGLLLLAAAQRDAADSAIGDLLDTKVGHALVERAVALGTAGAALAVASLAPSKRSLGLVVAGAAAVAGVVVHVAAGHAAASGLPSLIAVTAQSAHFAAAGVWIGGLAALVLGLRERAAGERGPTVRRFSTLAAAALLLVVATGTLRAIDELTALGDLVSTGYGRAVLGKIVVLGGLVAFAGRSRRRGVPAADSDPGLLRRSATAELGLGAGALAVAALLAALAPPVAGQAPPAARGLTATGTDPTGAVRAELSTSSRAPGANRFVVELEDARSGDRIAPATARLRFTPLDDPTVRPTTLPLRATTSGTLAASGENLAFDGRWRADVVVTRGTSTVTVPLELTVPTPRHFVSVLAPPGEPPVSTMLFEGLGNLRVWADPTRPGPSTVHIEAFDLASEDLRLEAVVLTIDPEDVPVTRQSVRRVSPSRFTAAVVLPAGRSTLAVVAHRPDGTRLRGEFPISAG
jgi:copper transport protein